MTVRKGTESPQRISQCLEAERSIIDGISDALVMLDAKTYEIIDVNQAFLDLYNVEYEKAVGKTCFEITRHQSNPCSQIIGNKPCPLRESVSTGSSFNVEHVRKDKDGNKFYLEITSYPLKNVHGEVTRIIQISRDVSKRRRAEELLREKLTKSEHLAAIGQLVAEITHEVKNPLMMIGGFAQQLIRPIDEETKVKKLTIIVEQVKRLEKLIADLKELYTTEAPVDEMFNIKDVLDRVSSLVKEACAKNGVRMEIVVDENELLVKGDSRKIEQVFLNVIKNSLEAMENGGKLSAQVKLMGGKVETTISDDGCGIAKEHLDKILECFFTTKSHGTGLGLCISKKYIDELEGSSFSVKSEEGKGTTVKISLPFYPGDS